MSSSSSEDTDVGDRGKDGKMDIKEILSHVDHTELSPAARLDDIKFLIDDAIKYSTATVCHRSPMSHRHRSMRRGT